MQGKAGTVGLRINIHELKGKFTGMNSPELNVLISESDSPKLEGAGIASDKDAKKD